MKKTFFTLGCLTLLALIVRLFLIQYYQCIDTDGVSYVSIAKELFEKHRLLDRFYPPLYPFLLGLTSYMFNNYELAGRFVSAVLGALLVIPTYFLGKEIYGKKTGVIASIFVIIHPGLTDYSARVLTESTSTFFLTLFLLVSIHAIKSSKWWLYVISGFLIGIAYLTRPEALGFLPYFIGASITIVLFGKAGDPKNLIKNLVFFLLASMTLMLPYMIFVGGLSGKTGLHLVVAESVGEENFPRAVDIQITKYNPAESPSFFNELLRNPYKMAKRWVINLHLTHKFVIPGLFPPLLLIAIGFGIFRMKFRFTQWKELYIAFSWIPYLFVLFLIIVGARFLLPLIPVSLILGARGIEIVEDRLYKRVMKIKNLPIKQTVHHLIFAAVLLSLLPYTFRPLYRPDDNAIYRDAGIWIKENIPPPIKIIDRKSWVAFYSNAELIPLPIGEYDEVIQYAYKKDADYLIIDNRVIPEVRPELTFLLSKYFVPHELKLVREFKNKNGQIVLLYQILRDK